MRRSALDRLGERQLVVVTGKGGVGKSTLTAVLGRLMAGRGKRVLLLEVDPRESLHQALGTEPSGGAMVAAGPGLTIQNLQPATVIEGLVREKVRIPYLARKITESVAYRQFVDAAPGLKETAVLGYAYRVLQGSRRPVADQVIVDAPATGHSATMMAAPGLLAEACQGGQLGGMAADLAAYLADGSRCGVMVATLAEEMPIQETLELIELLRSGLGIRPGPGGGERALPRPDPGPPRARSRSLDGPPADERGRTGPAGRRLGRPPAGTAPPAPGPGPGAGGGFGGGPGRRWTGEPDLLRRHLTVVVGGGGVGKTTLAAALALGSAREGRRTLVMTIDPSLRLKDALGVGEEAKDEPVRVFKAGSGFPGRRPAGRQAHLRPADPHLRAGCRRGQADLRQPVLPGPGRQPFGNPGIHGHGTPVRDAGLRPL